MAKIVHLCFYTLITAMVCVMVFVCLTVIMPDNAQKAIEIIKGLLC